MSLWAKFSQMHKTPARTGLNARKYSDLALADIDWDIETFMLFSPHLRSACKKRFSKGLVFYADCAVRVLICVKNEMRGGCHTTYEVKKRKRIYVSMGKM